MPGPRVVVRDEDDALILRPGWALIVVAAVGGLGLLTGLGFGVADGTVGLGLGAAIVVIAVFLLVGAIWLARAREHLLVVNRDGICSPLLGHAGPIRWDRVVAVHIGGRLLPGSIEVRVPHDPADPTRGTTIGLRVPPGLAPMRPRRLRDEIDRRRARHSPAA